MVKTRTFIGLVPMLAVLVALVVGYRSSVRAEPVASITLPPPGAMKQLYEGCNNIAVTFPDGTPSETVIQAVDPAGAVRTMWRHDAAEEKWEGYAPAFPAVSDLLTVNFLDAVWLCIATAPSAPIPTPPPTGTAATVTPTPEPPQGVGTATPGPPPQVTVPRAVAPTDALTTFRYSMATSIDAGAEMSFAITSKGAFEAPDRVSCAIAGSVGPMTFGMADVVVIGNDAWINLGEGWTATTASDPNVVENLKLCPGSSVFWDSFELPEDLSDIQGEPVTVNGIAAVRLSLAGLVEVLPILGIKPSELAGITIHAFDIWLAQDGAWVVALASDVTVAESLGGTSGVPSGTADGSVRIRMRVDVTNANDVSIHVDQPIL